MTEPNEKKKISESGLDVLYEISTIISDQNSIEQCLRQVFKVIDRSLGLIQGTLVLDKHYGDLQTEITSVLGDTDHSMLHEVARRAIVAGSVQYQTFNFESEESTKNAVLIASPMSANHKIIGALCFTVNIVDEVEPSSYMPFISSLATMLAQSLVLQGKREILQNRSNRPRGTENQPQIKTKIRGNSKAVRGVFEQIRQVSSSDTTVLILGESGVGKELVASAIHDNSQRSKNIMVKVNCAALPDSLLESELFGHEKGSFTGATTQKKGRFEVANGGTLFLDEIGDISAQTQVKLLRFLQEKEFERVGGNETIRSDVRIIAATNKNLEEMIDSGEFRLDLYYRLNVFPIHVPALRERKPDIIPITDFFIERYNASLGKNIHRISTPAIDLLVSYHWPGNVRELENCIERAVLLSTDDVIHSHHLPPSLQTAEARTRHQESLRATLDSVERELISEALRNAGGNMAKASRALGLTERVMGLRTKKYHLDPKKFREN